jgi:hypothetical protein
MCSRGLTSRSDLRCDTVCSSACPPQLLERQVMDMYLQQDHYDSEARRAHAAAAAQHSADLDRIR